MMKLTYALLGTLVAMSSPSPASARVVTDFTEPSVQDFWITVNDNVMGGRSMGGPMFEDGTLVFSGITVTDGGGFSSIRTVPSDWNLGEYDGLLVRFRGDGRTYQFSIEERTASRSWRSRITHRIQFTADPEDGWQTARLPFADFRPTFFGEVVTDGRAKDLEPEEIENMGFMIYDKKAGPFRVEIDWIQAYADDD